MRRVRRLLCILVALMVLASTFPAYAQEDTNPPAQPQSEPGAGEPPADDSSDGQDVVDISTPSREQPEADSDKKEEEGAKFTTTISPEEAEKEFSPQQQEPFPGAMCVARDLTDKESQALFDLVKDGFLGNEISGDAKPEETKDFKLGERKREELPNKEIVIENPGKEGDAVKATIPHKKLEPFEVTNWLNSYINGPFAFGLVLSDTVRTGRCKDANTTDCFLVGKNLKYRNSGTGILANARPIKELGSDAVAKIKGIFTKTEEEGIKFTDEEQEILGAGLFNDIDDEVSIKTAKRLEKELIPNSIFTNDFKAKIGTNCTDDDCVISTYSMFDKYFNQWMSSEMVAANFGPSLLYRTKKLVGWVARRGSFLRSNFDKFRDFFRVNFESPGSFLGDLKLNRMHQRVDKHGWRSWWQDLTFGTFEDPRYNLIKTTEFQSWWGAQQAKGGFLDQIDTVEKKAEFIRVLKDLRTYVRGSEARTQIVEKKYKDTIKRLLDDGIANPYEHPEGKRTLIDYGREFGKMIQGFDDDLGVDGPDWFVRHPNMGFFDKGVKKVGTDEVIDLFQEHRNTRIIIDKFVDSGNWKNFENEAFIYRGAYETDGLGNLMLYGFDPTSAKSVGHIDFSGLHEAAKGRTNLWVKSDQGEFIRLTPTSVNFIKARTSQNPEVFQGNWAPLKAVTPEEFSMRLINPRVRPNFEKARGNVDQMLNTVKERNWVSRRYWSALDKLMAQEDELIRSYFSVKGGIKWTTYPFGYWWMKRGVGVEDISMYQLPDTWTYIFIKHGNKEIYDFAYIDFFANAGSDQGDIFVQVINKLPWKLIMDELSDRFNPIRKLYDKITGKELRNEVENLAFYMTGPSECDNCFMKIETDKDFQNFRPFFVVKNKNLTSYILEDTQSSKAKEKGQTIIAFAHRTNLAGKTGDVEGEEIDILEAKRNESEEGEEDADLEEEVESCKEAIKSLPGYTTFKQMPLLGKLLPEDEKIGGVLFGAEALTYVTFFWPGIFATVAIQTLYAPKLQDCVDVDEGYFVHYFLATKKEETKTEQGNKVELSTEKVSNLISNLKESFSGAFQGDQNSLTKGQVEELGKEIDKFVKNAEESRIVQAKLDVSGTSAGQLKGVRLFYFWCGPGCESRAGEYRTQGHETVKDQHSDNAITFDYEKGQLLKNGEPIVTNEDAVRLADTELSIPGKKIPRRLQLMCVEPTEEVGIEIRANGEASALSPEVQSCIQDAVVEQTGLPLVSPSNLSQAFGLVQSVSTTTHPNISFPGDQIIAEGVPRKIATGAGATLKILNNRKAKLSHSNDGVTEVGSVKAIQFENGQMVVKPDGCYVVWLRHHEQGKLHQNDVEGLKPTLTTSVNPENDCPEPAIDLAAIANPDSPFLQSKVEKFNTSLKKMGPFQIFETPHKRFVLYSERDESGVCRDHLRVIDKDTGKTEDFVGTASQTPTGIEFTTDDGKTHTLDFDAPNGVPQVSFDGKKPETLTTAQGRNGAFWYDPSTGLWYADNAQILPLIEAFRDGISTKVGPDNTTTSTASGNVLNVQFGEDEGGLLNLPSLPQNKLLLLIFITGLIAAFVFTQFIWKKKKN